MCHSGFSWGWVCKQCPRYMLFQFGLSHPAPMARYLLATCERHLRLPENQVGSIIFIDFRPVLEVYVCTILYGHFYFILLPLLLDFITIAEP